MVLEPLVVWLALVLPCSILLGSNTFAVNGKVVDISIAGGGGGGSGGIGAALKDSDVESKLFFIHHGGFESNFDVESPRKFVEVFTHRCYYRY